MAYSLLLSQMSSLPFLSPTWPKACRKWERLPSALQGRAQSEPQLNNSQERLETNKHTWPY
jgi:hypothetical protein